MATFYVTTVSKLQTYRICWTTRCQKSNENDNANWQTANRPL